MPKLFVLFLLKYVVLTPPLHSFASQSASALTYDELQGLTYLQVKGTGVANTCPVIAGGSTNPKDIPAGEYKFGEFCMEPTSFTVKEDSQFKAGETEFVKTKLMTRLTYTLDDVSTAAVHACFWEYHVCLATCINCH